MKAFSENQRFRNQPIIIPPGKNTAEHSSHPAVRSLYPIRPCPCLSIPVCIKNSPFIFKLSKDEKFHTYGKAKVSPSDAERGGHAPNPIRSNSKTSILQKLFRAWKFLRNTLSIYPFLTAFPHRPSLAHQTFFVFLPHGTT